MSARPGAALALDDRVLRSMGVGRVFKEVGPGNRVNSLDFFRTGDLMVTGNDDDSIRVYNTALGMPMDVLYSKKYGVQNICWTHSEDCVIYASRKLNSHMKPTEAHALRYHSLHTNNYIRYFQGHTAQVTSLCMSPKNDTFVSAAQDKSVRLWDVRTNIAQGCLSGIPGMPTATIDQQGLVFAVATESGIIKLYDLRSYDKGPFDTFAVEEERNCPSGFSDIKFSNNGNILMGVVEGRIYLLDAYKGMVLKRFTSGVPEAGTAVEACISPDNQYLLSGCDDRAIRVWHIDSGREVAVWAQHAGVPTCLRFSNRRVLCASACSATILWIPNLPLLEGMR